MSSNHPQQQQHQQKQRLIAATTTTTAPIRPPPASVAAASSHYSQSHTSASASATPYAAAVGFGPQHGVRLKNQHDHDNDDDDNDDDDDTIDLEQVKLDAANDAVVMGIFVALAFFTLLFATAMGLVLLLVSQFGLIAWVAVSSLTFILVGGGVLTYKYMTQEKKMRKAHKHIVYWKEVATQVIVNEIHNFKEEMNQHLYITDGSEYENSDNDNDVEDRNPTDTANANSYTAMDDHNRNNNLRQLPSAESHSSTKSGDSKKSKSVLFGLIRPFLSKKRKTKNGAKQQNEKQRSKSKPRQSNITSTRRNDPATFATQGTYT
jgi:hypothetical protein